VDERRSGGTDYASYLLIDDLLRLQRPITPGAHDELLFIVVHQAYELWFKLILHELVRARDELVAGSPAAALPRLRRVAAVWRVLLAQLDVLETMGPEGFLEFRDPLAPASGFQSLQFREIEYVCGLRDDFFQQFFERWPESAERLRARAAAPSVYDHFLRALAREGNAVPAAVLARDVRHTHELTPALVETLRRLYQEPREQYHWVLLCEALLDLDTAWSRWRAVHVLMVSRTIGGQSGTGGSSGAAFLESRLKLRFFPELWEVRNALWGQPA
jgi:tryptophan 2,3-dioxygenase